MSASPVENLRAPGSVASQSDVLRLLESKRVLDGLNRVAGKIMDPERLVKLAVFSVRKTPKLQLCTPGSVLGALMLSASFGLEPNTPSQQAFLIPYKKRRLINRRWVDQYECQFQFGYRGMITLAYRSGIVTRLKGEAVREEDEFDYAEGSEPFLKFKKALTKRGALIGAFCFTELKTGEHAATVLPADFIEKVRGRSETYQALQAALFEAEKGTEKAQAKAIARFEDTPWNAWADQMWAKTAIKAHIGQLPVFDIASSTILSSAVALDDASDHGVIDMEDFTGADAALAAANGEFSTADDPDEEAHGLTHEIGLGGIETRREPELVVSNTDAQPSAEKPAEKPVEKPVERQAEAPRRAAPARAAPPPPEEPAGFVFGSAE